MKLGRVTGKFYHYLALESKTRWAVGFTGLSLFVRLTGYPRLSHKPNTDCSDRFNV
jgi:hypothetical protein